MNPPIGWSPRSKGTPIASSASAIRSPSTSLVFSVVKCDMPQAGRHSLPASSAEDADGSGPERRASL
jgi:hypothetical protein